MVACLILVCFSSQSLSHSFFLSVSASCRTHFLSVVDSVFVSASFVLSLFCVTTHAFFCLCSLVFCFSGLYLCTLTAVSLSQHMPFSVSVPWFSVSLVCTSAHCQLFLCSVSQHMPFSVSVPWFSVSLVCTSAHCQLFLCSVSQHMPLSVSVFWFSVSLGIPLHTDSCFSVTCEEAYA